MNRRELLETAAGPLERDRESTYGDFHACMDMFGRKIRKMFLTFEMHKRYSDAHNGAYALSQLKDVRILLGQHHEDNYLDKANYIAQANASQQVAKEAVLSGSIGGITHHDIPASAFESQVAGKLTQITFGIGELILETEGHIAADEAKRAQITYVGDCMMELIRRREQMRNEVSSPAQASVLNHIITDNIAALKYHLPDGVRVIIPELPNSKPKLSKEMQNELLEAVARGDQKQEAEWKCMQEWMKYGAEQGWLTIS